LAPNRPRQTNLEEFWPYVCHRCGTSFQSERGLKVHLAAHRRKDLHVIRSAFDNLEITPNIYGPSALVAILKAIISDTKDEAVAHLSSVKELSLLAIAVNHSYDYWERSKDRFLKSVLSKHELQELIRAMESPGEEGEITLAKLLDEPPSNAAYIS